mmetsp:Transcript_35052/g.69046  ORF Transcript_35052/g.69046 Transcript_35052/m.69046 type:complete len:237 (+) Transcript_35052:91-801(+)|eukprot:CAMPEP_0194331900 /NCGR_PEP_ID=MMETSP0171-20130528/57320_1 /TAXON_ID=218684 /ORGANISM="Corethron pennatum, Strain L29A3" /LENGTH=236 /DNA_ID=CAMNT_0039093567 /DNA_START=34 /DNA_END=744 /DNA_ORIENTATION=+
MKPQNSSINNTKRKRSLPPDGYVCAICAITGHWIQQCSQRDKKGKKSKTSNHVYQMGVDPSEKDILEAKELQKIKPPLCFCRIASRLKKVKRSNADEHSRAIGKYFFFCKKKVDDNTKCRFARPLEDYKDGKWKSPEKITNKIKKGDECTMSHRIEAACVQDSKTALPVKDPEKMKEDIVSVNQTVEKGHGDKESINDSIDDNNDTDSDSDSGSDSDSDSDSDCPSNSTTSKTDKS